LHAARLRSRTMGLFKTPDAMRGEKTMGRKQ
jgi:hypothetical protein